MGQENYKLGAFWVQGKEQPFFGLRDAKNYQMIKGGDISGPSGEMLYPDLFPGALLCTKCTNRIIPKPAVEVEGEEAVVRPPQTVCDDCDGGSMAVTKKKEKRNGGGIFNFFS